MALNKLLMLAKIVAIIRYTNNLFNILLSLISEIICHGTPPVIGKSFLNVG